MLPVVIAAAKHKRSFAQMICGHTGKPAATRLSATVEECSAPCRT